MTTKRIAILGYGAVGRSIAERLGSSPLPDVKLVAIVMRSKQLAQAERTVPCDVLTTSEFSAMLKTEPDIVVEAAGHGAVAEHGCAVLSRGCKLFVLSTGALADEELSGRLLDAAVRAGGRIVIPSGALAGFDGLLTLRQAGLTAVTYRVTKPVTAWYGTAAAQYCRLAELRHAQAFFSGSAREAALRFPKNANLAVSVALAGVGLDRTQVDLVADPHVRTNTGEVVAQAKRSRLELKLINAGFESNPKSSEITGLSVIAALANHSAVITYQ